MKNEAGLSRVDVSPETEREDDLAVRFSMLRLLARTLSGTVEAPDVEPIGSGRTVGCSNANLAS